MDKYTRLVEDDLPESSHDNLTHRVHNIQTDQNIQPSSHAATGDQDYLEDGVHTTVKPADPNVIESSAFHVYKRRWYMLFLYCTLVSTQGGVWNTFGPIADSANKAFSWNSGVVPWLANWGPISYIVAMIPYAWLLDRKGLRVACLATWLVVATGTAVRCITSHPPAVTWLMHLGQALNGVGGPIAMGAPPALSAAWFPPHQRTTATSIAVGAGAIGNAIAFLVGPLLVPAPKNVTGNGTHSNISTMSSIFDEEYNVDEERTYIMRYMYIWCGWACFWCLLMILYFPSHPPTPPSMTASIERLDFLYGLKQLLRNTKFWMIVFTYGLSSGVYDCWQAVLSDNLQPINISQTDAGWIGFYGSLVALPAGVAVSRFADKFTKHMRLYLTLLYSATSACFLWVALMIAQIIPSSIVTIYTSIILGGLLIGAASPLFYEMSCETTYPIAEGITVGVLTVVNNAAGLVFLGVLSIPNIGTVWANWCLFGAVVTCVPVLMSFREKYNRITIDENVITPDIDVEVKAEENCDIQET